MIAVPPLLLGAIAALDVALRRMPHGVLVTGLLDEPAHLATAGLALLATVGRPRLSRYRALTTVAVVCSVAIDLDHLPLCAGLQGWSAGGRPVTHSLATVVVLLVVAVLWRRPRLWLLAAATGVLLHFLRDIGTGPGLPLLWPLSQANLRIPYRVYLALMVVLAGVAAAREAVSPRTLRGRREVDVDATTHGR